MRIGRRGSVGGRLLGLQRGEHGLGGLHLFADWNSRGPNLLDEPFKDYIVNSADLLW